MPPMETADLHQKAMLWEFSGHDRYQQTVSSGVELNVRWEDKREETVDAEGRTVAVEATVVVDQKITVGSIMWKGKETDLPDPVTDVTDLKIVVAYNETPDIKGRNIRRTVKLARYNDTLPTIA